MQSGSLQNDAFALSATLPTKLLFYELDYDHLFDKSTKESFTKVKKLRWNKCIMFVFIFLMQTEEAVISLLLILSKNEHCVLVKLF